MQQRSKSPAALTLALLLIVAINGVLPGQQRPTTTTQPAALRVACVGDSITFGSGLKDRQTQSYPAQLRAMFEKAEPGKWDVQNFGVSGTTLLKKGDRPYWDQKRFTAAKAFAPNVVVIKLGTNDSKPQNWRFRDHFRDDLIALIGEFRALPSQPAVYLCRPVPAFPGQFGIREEVIRDEILPILDAVATEQRTPVIDLYRALSGKPEHFPDQIHPDADGAKLMAAEVFEALAAVAAPTSVPADPAE